MATFDEIQKPVQANLLICFCDLANFTSIAKKLEDSLEIFEVLNGMAVAVVRFINSTKGRVIKFIGDSWLIVFPEEAADDGIRQLLELRDRVIEYFKNLDISMKLHVGVHFGEVAIGPYGEQPCRTIDILGDSVNKAAALAGGREYRGKFVISPQAFRKLKPETRKVFHKYTPPVVYIAE